MSANANNFNNNDRQDGSRTELDSHVNMPVVGKNVYILAKMGKTVEVNPFTPDYEAMEAELVDAAVQYDSPYNGMSTILVIQGPLYVPSMNNNLILPFMLREAGVKVNKTPKIQVKDPDEDDHAIIFPETKFRILLSLWGIFSYFPMCKPTQDIMVDPPDVYLLTPTTWNPHLDAYSFNKQLMLDWEGNMKPKRDRECCVVLDELEEDKGMVSSL